MRMLRVLFIVFAFASGSAADAQALRPEIGKPLQHAAQLLKAGKAREALAAVNEADKVPRKTADEQLTIERMRGAAAQRAGDNATAIRAFESAYASGKLSAAEQAQIAESLAYAYSQNKDWPKTQAWIAKAQQAGSNSAQLRQLQSYVQGQTGDYNAIAHQAEAAVAAAEKAGRKPAEDDLLRLADADQHLNNTRGYNATLEKLLFAHPKKDYWSAYLARLPRKNGFAERYGLDVMRLKLATGTMDKADEFMEMAQLSLQAGYPAEGRKVIEQGFASGVLGNGVGAGREKRLRDLAVKQDAQARADIAAQATEAAGTANGDALVHVGWQYVTMGEVDKGIALIQQGIAKGGLKRPDEAQLRLGMAQLQSPKEKAKARQTLRAIKGNDGSADIARLWLLVGTS